jgi:hypothetical protein
MNKSFKQTCPETIVVHLKFSEYRQNTNVKFSVDPSKYTIIKLDSAPALSDKVFSIIKDQNEVTIVAKEGFVSQPISVEGFLRRITFDVALPYDLIGFVAHVSTLLAKKNVPILVYSAYSTDHLFVKEEDLGRTVEALEQDGMTYTKRD